MMSLANDHNEKWNWALTYVVLVVLAVFFSKGLATLHPAYLLVSILTGFGFGLSVLLWNFLPAASTECSFARTLGPMLVYQVIQAGLGFVLARYVFNASIPVSLAFGTGAIMALSSFGLLTAELPHSLISVLLAGFYAGGLTLSLRLGGVSAGLLFGIALLNGFFLGWKLLGEELSQKLWSQGLLAAGLLVVGRAALQIYLLESGYVSGGIVISHSYTFLALFAGLLVPWVFYEMGKEKSLPAFFLFLALAVVLPVALGVFIHARPMGGYLMGLIVSSFVLGIFFDSRLSLYLLTYVNLALVNVALPLFKSLAGLSRWTRLEILGGIFLLSILLLFIFVRGGTQKERPALAS